MDHPFVLKFVATYQDEGELKMLLELGLGGELFSLLAKQAPLPEAGTAIPSPTATGKNGYLLYHNSSSLSNQKLIFGVLEMPNQVSFTPHSQLLSSSPSQNRHIHPYLYFGSNSP